MERRLLTFIVASTAFFFAYVTLRTMFVPPPPPKPAVEEIAGDAPGDAETAADADGVAAGGADAGVGDAEGIEAVDRPARAKWVTLGSMDPSSKQLMLITLNSLGGGVERVELTERDENGRFKYRRVDVRHGYLGYLAGEATADGRGVRVNVVGPGTPAALALGKAGADGKSLVGLRPGDIIIAVNGRVVATPEEIDAALVKTEPNKEAVIEVLRDSESEQVAAADAEAGDMASQAKSSAALEFVAKLSEHPLDLVRLASAGGEDEIAGNLSRLSCLLTLAQVNRKRINAGENSINGLVDPATLLWNVESKSVDGAESAEFSLEMSAREMNAIAGKPVRMKRSYTLSPGSYAIDMSVQMENLHDEPQNLAYRLEGVNGLTLEGWWYSNKISPNFSGAAARDVIYKTSSDGYVLWSGFNLLKKATNTPRDPAQTIFAPDGDATRRELKYIGVDAQYFVAAYLPPEGSELMTSFSRAAANVVADPLALPKHKERAVNVSFFLESEAAEVPAGGLVRQDLRIFAGPKQPELLEQYGLGDSVYYGWFALAAKLLAGLLHVLYAVVGNYAVAIILLTVIVRGAMFPLSRKAAINAQRMQELAPEMKKIAEKYKDDMEGRMRAQRELQQRVGFNPLAGCLPMFLQLPIFIGLYRALSVDIELRQAAVSPSLQWASNLAGPDMLYYWGDWLWDYLGGRGTGWLGPYFNILPVIVVGLFLVQQKLFMPPATDEQQVMTQKIMNIMTLMMGLFFFRVPAGLCIYFITSSLWGICERILVKKTLPQTKHFDSGVIDGTATPVDPSKKDPSKKESFSDAIRRRMNPPEEPIERPGKRRRPDLGKKKR